METSVETVKQARRKYTFCSLRTNNFNKNFAARLITYVKRYAFQLRVLCAHDDPRGCEYAAIAITKYYLVQIL